jgi:hypothetical protein
MSIKNKKAYLFCGIIGAILIISTSVYAVNLSSNNKGDADISKNDSIKNYNNNGNDFKKLSKEEIQKLYDQGFTLKEIQDAESLSNITDSDIYQILRNKDNPKFYLKNNQNANQIITTQEKIDNSNEKKLTKEDFIKQYKAEKNITDEEVEICNKNGITEILQVGYFKYLSEEFSVPFEEVINMFMLEKDTAKLVRELGAKK